jgi:hypothetical protein
MTAEDPVAASPGPAATTSGPAATTTAPAATTAAPGARPPSRMAALKAERGPASDELLGWIREHNAARTAIRRALAEKGPLTVPELAEATGLTTRTVFWTVTTMRKYGTALEDSTDGSSVRYAAATTDPRS